MCASRPVKWPPLWYGAYWTLDTLGRYPHLRRNGSGYARRSLAELVACLVTYNVSSDGTVTPRSVYRGFQRYSFGQKKQPSPTATALLSAVVRRFSDLTDDIMRVDVARLGSSKRGFGHPRGTTDVTRPASATIRAAMACTAPRGDTSLVDGDPEGVVRQQVRILGLVPGEMGRKPFPGSRGGVGARARSQAHEPDSDVVADRQGPQPRVGVDDVLVIRGPSGSSGSSRR